MVSSLPTALLLEEAVVRGGSHVAIDVFDMDQHVSSGSFSKLTWHVFMSMTPDSISVLFVLPQLLKTPMANIWTSCMWLDISRIPILACSSWISLPVALKDHWWVSAHLFLHPDSFSLVKFLDCVIWFELSASSGCWRRFSYFHSHISVSLMHLFTPWWIIPWLCCHWLCCCLWHIGMGIEGPSFYSLTMNWSWTPM